MRNNYHTHTFRCGHAIGQEEDMVLAAIDEGLDGIGFSEHVPLPHYRWHLFCAIPFIRSGRDILSLGSAMLRNGPNMRLSMPKKKEHLDHVTSLKEKYADQISVYQGFEAEGFQNYFPYYQKMLDNGEIDYLILGHHFHKKSIHSRYYGKPQLSKKEMYQYCNDVEQALESELFSYLAHPDIFLLGYKEYDNDMMTVSRRICQKCKDLNIPLELNGGGIRRGLVENKGEILYLYPNHHFWQIASEIGNDVVLGVDAHSPQDFNGVIYEQLNDFAKDLNLNLIDRIEFRKGKQKK